MIRDERLDAFDVLECQQCGVVLRQLTPAQAKEVARNPYNYIEYCRVCIRDQPFYRLLDRRYR